MESLATIAIAGIGVVLVAAYLLDVVRWRRMELSKLEEMAGGSNWKLWKGALIELHRRGESIDRYVPSIVNGLFANTVLARECARITLVDHFPELREQLAGYKSTDAPEVLRDKFGNISIS